MNAKLQLQESRSARFAMACSAWAERWFPDSWVFATLAVLIVAVATLAMGASPGDTAKAFGDGFWSLIPFTMQMAFVVIGGYVVASSGPASRLIALLARVPKNGRSAVAWVAVVSMLASLLNWGLSLVFGGLRLHQPNLVLQVFPILLFTLYGAGWGVAYAVKRKAWFAWIVLGCFLAALGSGALMGSPDQWLVLALGLFAFVAAPGAVIVRQARGG